MDKLTDLELEKRIAEIEGIEVSESVMMVKGNPIPTGRGLITDEYIEFNPLTDDALCHRLMIKHKVYVDYFCGNARAALKYNGSDCEFQVDVVDISMNRAICMAIVEANNG